MTTVFALIILGSIYFLYNGATSELAPQEDQGVVITSATTAADSTLQQRQLYDRQIYQAFASYPESDHVFQTRYARPEHCRHGAEAMGQA